MTERVVLIGCGRRNRGDDALGPALLERVRHWLRDRPDREVRLVEAARRRLAALLNTPVDNISVKAKTPEGMGTDNAAIAHAVVLLQKREARSGRKALKTAVRRPRKRAKPMKR